jgi:hypothetical protein
VFIDIDNDPEAVTAFKQYFRQHKTTYSMWESGGKGVHFHLPTSLLSGVNLPFVHANYVKSTGIPCDPSLYRHNSLFRLPGTVHRKTKKIKKLLECYQGHTLTIPDSCFNVDNKIKIIHKLEKNYDEMTGSIIQWVHLRLNEPKEGTRYMSLWSVTTSLLQAGFGEDTVAELIEVLNEGWENPKEAEEVERVIRDAVRGCSTSVDRERSP